MQPTGEHLAIDFSCIFTVVARCAGRPPEGPQGASRGKYDGFIEVKHNFWLSPGGGHGGTSHAKRRLLRGAGKTPHFDLNHSNTDGFSRVS